MSRHPIIRSLGLVAGVASSLILASSIWLGSVGAHASGNHLWTRTFEQGPGAMRAWYDVNGLGRTTVTAHGGSYALDADGQNFWGIEERWPGMHRVMPGSTYRFTGWLKVSPGTAQDVTVTAYFVNSGQTAQTGVATVDVAHATASKWTRYSGVVTAPPGSATVGFRYEGPDAAHVYLDDVQAFNAKRPSLAQTETSSSPTPTETSSSPTPTETKPTRSPTANGSSRTQTRASTGGHVCSDPSTVFNGQGSRGLGDYYADANMWNAGGYDISQTMGVCSHHSWYVDVTAADHQDGAVLSYPNVHRDYHNWSTGTEPRVGSFDTISSTFAHRVPRTGVYDVAYDIWLNGVADSGSTELMIWTEYVGQRPAGSKRATVTVDGHSWDLWTTGDNQYVAFVATEPLTSGDLSLKAFMTYLMDHGRLAKDSTLGQIDYGVEVVATHGQRTRFDVTDFSVTTRGG